MAAPRTDETTTPENDEMDQTAATATVDEQVTDEQIVDEQVTSDDSQTETEVGQMDLTGDVIPVEDGQPEGAPAIGDTEANETEAITAPEAEAITAPEADAGTTIESQDGDATPDDSGSSDSPEAETEPLTDPDTGAAVADAAGTADPDTTDSTSKPVASTPDQPVTEADAADVVVAGTETPATDRKGDGDSKAARKPAQSDDEPSVTFEELGLTGDLLKSLKDVGYEAPTPIQMATIPDLLRGRDVIAQAQTGSGKTAAFGLPIIESIDPSNRRVQALILCPTRELAIQVAEALHKYGRHKHVETLPIYGGQAYERQFRGLQRGVQIVVGTPGRVMDHMRRGSLSLEAARFFVLDEADEMLDMGFIDDVDWILGQVPESRQMALFSATMPPRIEQLARNHMKDPARISVRGKEVTVPTTTQSAYEVPRSRKVDALNRILDAEEPSSAMIFCRTKNGVDELGEALLARGYAVETLHGDLSQAQRDRVMKRFRSGTAEILIATDVAARGLDIPEVSHVVNYDIPESTEAYVHRIGRTGRAGRAGDAITLVSPRELRWLRQIERATKGKIDVRRLPTLADVADRRREVMKNLISDTLRDESNYEPYLEVVEQLAEDNDMSAIAAAVLKLYADETGRGAITEHTEDDLATFGSAQRGRGEQGMTRLFLNIGRAQGIRPQDIVGAIANEANIPGRSIGAIDILDQSTFVDVPTASVQAVMEAMQTIRMKGRPVQAEVSTEAPRTGEGGGRGGGGGGRFNDRGPRRDRGGFDRGPRDGQFGFGDRGPRRFDDREDRGPRDDRGPRGGQFGFEDRGPRRDDRGPRRFEDRDDRGPRRDDRSIDRDDRGPRREDRPFDRTGGGPRRFDNDRGPRENRGPRDDRGPRRFDEGPRQDRNFDRPRRQPEREQPYRPFHRDDNGE